MRVLGIDPGIAIVGYGIIDYENNKYKVVDYGAITTEAGTPLAIRLNIIFTGMNQLIDKFKPDIMSIEELFFNKNVKTAITVAQARGVSIVAASVKGIDIYEYTPLQIKQALVGYGRAEKTQIQQVVKMFLGLPKVPKPDDVADALAIAICYTHFQGGLSGKFNNENKIN